MANAEGALRSRGAEVVGIRADVTDPATPEHLVSVAIDRFGRLDIVVPNAGGPPAAAALDCEDEAILRAVQANLLTSVRFVRASLPHLRAAGWGTDLLHSVVDHRGGQSCAGAVQHRPDRPVGLGEDSGRRLA